MMVSPDVEGELGRELDEEIEVKAEETEMLLVPLWIYAYLDKSVKGETIGGEMLDNIENQDTDVRYGCMAVGVFSHD